MSGRLGESGKQAPRNPVPTVDIIIEQQGGIVLVERRNPPPGWALPGGFVDYGESAEDPAALPERMAFDHREIIMDYVSGRWGRP